MNVLSKWSPREAQAGKKINLKEMRDRGAGGDA